MNLQLMKKLCCLNKDKLKYILAEYLSSLEYNVIIKEKYIYAEGSLPVCLIAHIDTVFAGIEPLCMDGFIYDQEQQILWYPYGAGFDDRAGIYIIIQMLAAGFRPSIVFTDEEESGGKGAKDLITDYPKCPISDCRALIQLDRAFQNDSVFYNCDNDKFESYINKYGFKTSVGTFTDISIIAPQWKIAAVNLSVGYIDEHDVNERLYCKWCDETIEKLERILREAHLMDHFKYVTSDYVNMKCSFDMTKCLMCGKPFTNSKFHTIRTNGMPPYLVCDPCFHRYY